MQAPSVKFCGLTRPVDVATAISLGAEFLGFIVECKSPRRLSVADATRLAAPAKGLARCVAVTVNPDDELIESLRTEMAPDYIQLHGDEGPDRIRDIKSRTGAGLIKAIGINKKTDLLRVRPFEGVVDYLLLDAKPPRGAAQRGGHGTAFDWRILRGFTSKTPAILAGGLSPQTIAEARAITQLNIFDVSSGVEASAGIKDPLLMAAFMKAAQYE